MKHENITRDILTERVLASFWSDTRQQYLPLTTGDVANRAGTSPRAAAQVLIGLCYEGKVTSCASNSTQTYDIAIDHRTGERRKVKRRRQEPKSQSRGEIVLASIIAGNATAVKIADETGLEVRDVRQALYYLVKAGKAGEGRDENGVRVYSTDNPGNQVGRGAVKVNATAPKIRAMIESGASTYEQIGRELGITGAAAKYRIEVMGMKDQLKANKK